MPKTALRSHVDSLVNDNSNKGLHFVLIQQILHIDSKN